MSLAKGILRALENSMMKGLNNAAQTAAQTASKKAAPYSINTDVANLYNDINTTRATTITTGRFGEANAKMLEKMNEIVERGGTRQELEDTIFQTAGVYSKLHNTPMKNSLTTAQDSANNFLNRAGYSDMPNVLNKTQDEYDQLFAKHQTAIESAHIDPNFETNLNMKFNARLKKQGFEQLERANNVLYYTGEKLTGNDTTNLKLFGMALDNRNKQQIESLLSRVQRRLEQERPLYEQNIDDLINNLLRPNVTKSDIINPLLKVRAIQDLSFGEANDILSQINYLRQNRQEVTAAKNFTKKDWDNLQTKRGEILNYLQGARSSGQTPLSKGALALSKGKRKEDKKFLNKASGQYIYHKANKFQNAPISGKVDNRMVGYSIRDVAGNEAGLVFRQDEIPQILESGLSEFPHLRKKLLGFALMTDLPGKARKNLPFDLRKHFVPEGIIKDRNDLSLDRSDEVIPDNFAQMYDEISIQLNLELPTHNGIYYKNLPEDEQAQLFAYYADKYILLKTNQNLGEFLPKTLELDKQKNLYEMDLGYALIEQYSSTKLTPAIKKFLHDMIDMVNPLLATGIGKVIKQAYPEYFNQYLKYTNILPAIERLKALQKNMGFGGNDIYDMFLRPSELKNSDYSKAGITSVNTPDSRQLMNKYNRYEQEFLAIYKEFDRYVSGLNGKFIGVQSIDLPEGWLVPYMDEKNANIISDGKGNYRVIEKDQYDSLKAEYGDEGTKQAAQNYGAITSFSDEFDILDPGKGQRFNADDTVIDDVVKADFIKYGGQPGLEHFYNFDSNPLPPANSKIILQNMNYADDIENLKNFRNWLIGKPVTKKGKETYPNKWSLKSQISYITGATDKLELDDIFDKLMNYRDFVRNKKQELLSKKTPGRIDYLEQDPVTHLDTVTSVDAKSLYELVLKELDDLEKTINASLHQINWKWFNESLEASENPAHILDKINGKTIDADMVTDSTMLDYMTNKGRFSDEPLDKQTYLDMRAGRIPSQKEVLDEFIDSRLEYLFQNALDTNIVKEQYDTLMNDLINGLYIKTAKDYWSNAMIGKNRHTELKDLKDMAAEDHFKQRQLGFNLDRMSQENRHQIDHFTRVLKNVDKVKNDLIDEFTVKIYEGEGENKVLKSEENKVLTFIHGYDAKAPDEDKVMETLVTHLRKAFYNLFKLNKEDLAQMRINIEQDFKQQQQRYKELQRMYGTVPDIYIPVKGRPLVYNRTIKEMNTAFDGMLYTKETRQRLVLNAIMDQAEKKVPLTLPLPKITKSKLPQDNMPEPKRPKGLTDKEIENLAKRSKQQQQEKDWIDEWTRKKNEPEKPMRNQAAGLDDLAAEGKIPDNPWYDEAATEATAAKKPKMRDQASGIDDLIYQQSDEYTDDLPWF